MADVVEFHYCDSCLTGAAVFVRSGINTKAAQFYNS